MIIDPEKIAHSEVVPWLAYLASEGCTLGEGELAEALGIDRVSARDEVIRGGEIAERVKNARVARIRREREDERTRVAAAMTGQFPAKREPYGQAHVTLLALLADNRPRTTAEVAVALGLTYHAATARLRRCADVQRKHGAWTIRKEQAP